MLHREREEWHHHDSFFLLKKKNYVLGVISPKAFTFKQFQLYRSVAQFSKCAQIIFWEKQYFGFLLCTKTVFLYYLFSFIVLYCFCFFFANQFSIWKKGHYCILRGFSFSSIVVGWQIMEKVLCVVKQLVENW
jgi:hypothetical protein